jgi:hypothetical protein
VKCGQAVIYTEANIFKKFHKKTQSNKAPNESEINKHDVVGASSLFKL